MFLVDTHCHLNKKYYPDGLSEVFMNALKSDVKRLLFASADLASTKEAVALAEKHEGSPEVWALAGVHPHEASSVSDGLPEELERLAMSSKVSAVGELGLDFYYDHSPREIQREVFRSQIRLAKKIYKPVVIHVRDSAKRSSGDANSEALSILKEESADRIGGVIHCFSGDRQNAVDALDLGFYISFAGPITYPKNKELREIAMDTVPLDRILCETDSPYLAPQKIRGKKNEPCHVRDVYEMISMLKSMSLEDFAAAVKENGERLFGWGNTGNV
ncbi:MAG: TatD family hydrolase [Synergistaceae bacterium]|nr:TatD family hydrolase [Synergistaceae bacterium]